MISRGEDVICRWLKVYYVERVHSRSIAYTLFSTTIYKRTIRCGKLRLSSIRVHHIPIYNIIFKISERVRLKLVTIRIRNTIVDYVISYCFIPYERGTIYLLYNIIIYIADTDAAWVRIIIITRCPVRRDRFEP